MLEAAEKATVPVFALTDYDDALISISAHIVSVVRNLLSSFDEGAIEK
ncbi:MAG: hypothetical protein ACXABX_09275 [Candidatus Thorarchaeota archaeon]|jgi:hypothetical protein